MTQTSFDDASLRTAMAGFLAAADALDEASQVGEEARRLLDLAEAKAMAGMTLHKRLLELGWKAPAAQRSSA